MPWQDLLRPRLTHPGPVTELDVTLLQSQALRGIVLDVDDTLVPAHEQVIPLAVLTWIERLKTLGPVWLVSNNVLVHRIGDIAQQLNCPYICGAGKPSRRKLRQALQGMNLPPTQTAMIGDRRLTDILAGNRLGMYTVLVEPIAAPRWQKLRSMEDWLINTLL
ncbi:HAD family phosphatase [Gloeomargarita lithophora Alchichica-D10]|uniref:HAD family phosphatase n=1 Tax=Gloeomargarita lithophora Alchichica-D10 TaxID=1188229 RepID=A0A1J0AAD2_9CYAN|nr:YqeG family HAD IIIA-type phosphatase [Gloeomargarita lithophora]APB32887.1 HAD family phosphatase [Gloeomargarita lithophora Alchichica-D10]